MRGTRKIAAILVADVVGYSRLVGADEDRTLARLRALRSDLIDPTIAVHNGRLVKRTGDGVIAEFRSVFDAVRCALEVQDGVVERNAGIPAERQIALRIGIHVGDVVEESDGDLMGDAINIAARLEGICEPGGICVSEDAYRQVRDKIKDEFVDLGEQTLKNIARPVRSYFLAPGLGAIGTHSAAREPPSGRLALPDKPSIAVLPFQNLSGDPEQEYFADGMVEDIITGLSRVGWLFVIARNSSFVYTGKSVDVRQVGRELGVRYVLEGSVRKSGSRVRLTAQLLEAETGRHLWAEKYDGALEDVFELQDRITDQVVGVVEPSVLRSEIARSRRKRPESLDAYDLYLRALPYVAAHLPEDARSALPLLQDALKLEPDYAAAHALIAWCHELCFTRAGFNEVDKAAALRHARATIVSITDDATALAIAGFVISALAKSGSADHQAALSAIDRALSINPSSALALYLGAQAHACAGHPDTAMNYADRALRLSPFDPLAFEAHMAVGNATLQKALYEDAAASFAKAAEAHQKFSTAYFQQAIALALAGRLDEARPLLRRGYELEPGFRVRLFFEYGLAPVLAGELIKGARMLGLAE